MASKIAVGGELAPAPEPELGLPVDPRELRRGTRVFVPRLRAEAEVVEVLPGGQLRVAAGSLKLTVQTSEVRAPRPVPRVEPPRRERGRGGAPVEPIDEVAIPTSESSCDLRGLRADDAVRLAEQFLDRSLSENRRVAFLIHGHGTGALREAVRTALVGSTYVARVRPGGRDEGGDGVTVVFLR